MESCPNGAAIRPGKKLGRKNLLLATGSWLRVWAPIRCWMGS